MREISSSPNVLTDTKKLWRTVIFLSVLNIFSAIHLHMREAGRAIAGSKSPITAVVTTADICAIGIMEGARLGGYRVPIDLSVIGYDNLNLCQYTVPKLTSVSQNVPKKARLATELLLKKIHDNESDSNLGEIMDVEIVDRQSVISLY